LQKNDPLIGNYLREEIEKGITSNLNNKKDSLPHKFKDIPTSSVNELKSMKKKRS
jgi:hypothetical protein